MAEVNKETFFQGINKDTEFNEIFFKRVYGYSVCDPGFLDKVSTRLRSIGSLDIIQSYNEWFKVYLENDRLEIKTVSHWYIKECEKQWDKLKKDIYERAVEECREKQVKLLQKRKYLLSLMKQMSS